MRSLYSEKRNILSPSLSFHLSLFFKLEQTRRSCCRGVADKAALKVGATIDKRVGKDGGNRGDDNEMQDTRGRGGVIRFKLFGLSSTLQLIVRGIQKPGILLFS